MQNAVSLDIRRKLGILVLVTLSGMVLLLVLVYHSFTESLYAEKQQQSRALAQSGISIIEHFHQQAAAGLLSEETARQRSLAALRGVRYDSFGYFWIHQLNGNLLMHPVTPEKEGHPVAQWKDSRGADIFQAFDNTAQAGGGWVEYSWPKPPSLTDAPKISYVTLFEPWQWVIGTGIYLDDMAQASRAAFWNVAELAVAAILAVSGLALWLARLFEQQIHSLAIRDPLTQLFTRRYLQEHSEMLMLQDERNRYSHLYAIFLDIDHFKQINDRYGHPLGDSVLTEAAQAIQQQLRPNDLIIRYGGEEFLLLLQAPNIEQARLTAERIRTSIAAKVFTQGLHITLSAGIAQRAAAEPLETLIERADQLLYSAKAAGRNCVESQSDYENSARRSNVECSPSA